MRFLKLTWVLALSIGAMVVLLASQESAAGSRIPVFPGAQGFGSWTPAGRGGQVLKVTNLNDSGPGSLRAAVTAGGPRIVVFEVGGSIELKSALFVENPYLTIAGQSAPEPGIQLRNYGIEIDDTHDILIQHLRIHVSGGEQDGLRIFPNARPAYNIVIDHLTSNFATDENLSVFGPGGAHDITISNCLIAESGYGLLIGSDEQIANHIDNISVIGNLFAHNSERTPLIKHNSNVFVANNVMYNPTYEFIPLIGDFASRMKVTVVGNHMITGANSLTNAAIGMSAVVSGAVYENNNILDGLVARPLFNAKAQSAQAAKPPIWDESVTLIPAAEVKRRVTAFAGARPAFRDELERKIVGEVLQAKGVQERSGAGPAAYNTPSYRVFDAGANPNGDDDGDGYTNVEEILQRMAATVEGR